MIAGRNILNVLLFSLPEWCGHLLLHGRGHVHHHGYGLLSAIPLLQLLNKFFLPVQQVILPEHRKYVCDLGLFIMFLFFWNGQEKGYRCFHLVTLNFKLISITIKPWARCTIPKGGQHYYTLPTIEPVHFHVCKFYGCKNTYYFALVLLIISCKSSGISICFNGGNICRLCVFDWHFFYKWFYTTKNNLVIWPSTFLCFLF